MDPNQVIPFDPEVSYDALAVGVQAGIPQLMWGGPGIGKTAYVRALALAAFNADKGFVDERISTWSAWDARLPFPGENDFYQFQFAPYAERLTSNWDEATQTGSLLFFDEFSCAAPSIQKFALGVIQERDLGGLALPDGLPIIAAANPTDTATGTFELSAPAANRFLHLQWGVDLDRWCRGLSLGGSWGVPEVPVLPEEWRSGFEEWGNRVASFIQCHPTLAYNQPKDEGSRGYAWASPRSWHHVAKVLAAADSVNLVRDLRRVLVSGLVGNAAAIEFITFLEYQDEWDPKAFVEAPEFRFDIPDRADKRYAAVDALMSYCARQKNRQAFRRAAELTTYLIDNGYRDMAATHVGTLRRATPNGVKFSVECKDIVRALGPAFKEAGFLS